MNDSVLEATRNDHNKWDFDVTGDIDVADTIEFRAARREADLTVLDALIRKIRGAGVVDLDAATGKFQVQLVPGDTASLTEDEALVFDCVIHKGDTNTDTTVAHGVIRLTG